MSVFIYILIVNLLFNNSEYNYGVFWTLKIEIIYYAKCFRENGNDVMHIKPDALKFSALHVTECKWQQIM